MFSRKHKVSPQKEDEDEQISISGSQVSHVGTKEFEDDDLTSTDTSSYYESSEDYDEDYDGYSDNEQSDLEWIYECIRTELGEGLNEYLKKSNDKKQMLHIAASGTNVDLFEELLDYCEGMINEQNNKKKTPLHIAAKYDRKEIAEKILERNADITIRDSNQFTPLLTAVKNNSAEVFDLLKERMEDGNLQEFLDENIIEENDNETKDNKSPEYGKNDLNPIQIAVKYNSEKVAEKLITKDEWHIWGNTSYRNQYNLVYLATKNNSAKVLKILLEQVPDEFMECFANGEILQTEEMQSEENADDDEEMQSEENANDDEEMQSEENANDDEEVKSKGNPNADESDEKMTPLLVAAQRGYLKCLNYLIDSKANLYRTCKGGKTALHLAVENGGIRLVERLLKAAPRLKYLKDKKQRTALHDAINQVKIVEILVNAGAKLNKKDETGRTPLSYAAEKGKLDCISRLIEKGADVNSEDQTKMRPIHYAAKAGQSEVFRVLATNKNIQLTNWNCLQLAIDNDHEETALTIFQIEKENWRDMLRSRSKYDTSSNEYYDTPMRELIRKMPNVAKEVFNHCTEILTDNGQFQVTFWYEFLDDTYDLGEWEIHRTESPETAIRSENELKEQIASDQPATQNKPQDSNMENGPEQGCADPNDSNAEKETTKSLPQDSTHTDNSNTEDAQKNLSRDSTQTEESNTEDAAKETDQDGAESDDLGTDKKTIEYFSRDSTQTGESYTEDAAKETEQDGEEPDDLGTDKNTIESTKQDNSNVPLPEKGKERDSDMKKKNKCNKPYTENERFIKDNHPLMIMVQYQRTELLDHPLVSALLKSKWMNIGLKFSILNMLVYATFLVLLTGFALDVRAPYQFENSSFYSSFECPNFTKERIPEFASYAKYCIIVLASIELIIEVFEMKQMFSCKLWLYFLEIENLSEWITCITAILFVVNTTGCDDSGFRPEWQWTCGTISVFLAWINMLFLIRKFEWFGIYVVMLYRIIKLFMKFFFVFSLMIVAFAISFHCLFQNQEHFSTIWISLMKTTSMMIGGPDFVSTFLDETVHYEIISYAFFYVFMLLMAIVVINLLVGLAVSNIQEFQKEADIAKKKMQVKFALELERIATSRFLLKYFVSKFIGIIHKEKEILKPDEQSWLQTKVAESWNLSESHIKEAMRAQKDTTLRVVARLDTKMKILQTNLEAHMKFMDERLALILGKMEGKTEATQSSYD